MYKEHVKKSTRGPQWCIAQKMLKYVPEIDEVKTPSQTVADFLSREHLANASCQRRPFTGEYYGMGRPPQFEYNVASVRRRVRQLKAARG